MTRDTLFDVSPIPSEPMARARSTDPQTSREAAESVAPFLSDQLADVLAAVAAWPGRTSRELAEHLRDLDRYQVARRTSDLEHRGYVRKGHARPCRVGRRNAHEWHLTEAGRDELARMQSRGAQ